ncbi:flagellar motor protein MotB [Campylobacter mucosalis]|uniref:Flagellar motor protein n=1 Tax=Campylobacter mucosalis CCUG 21559 TaxID=1032067 RepID=A0A6G5QHN9_9BACT|nr:flagellar motor protein MotB [Campylobacter mucosalis]KEA46585.1 flagellar motor protein MotB [Campylobacter mucosalis]QCD45016.1 flagellar motor protein [Campylobacter mucosalis CCUG 21559]QKF62905.1 flagellar motor stator protein [Campylobacter mucosalis]
MGKLIRPEDCPKCMPGWLATFGDLMSLLLCFFVLLLSMSTMDAKKFETAVGSLAGALSILEGGARPETQAEQETELQSKIKKEKLEQSSQSSFAKTVQSINEILNSSGAPEVILQETEDGFILRMPSALLFEKGKAEISNDDAKLFLKRVAMITAKLPPDVDVNVIGHTDTQAPDMNSVYKDNWQLSSARAISVVDELIKDGVEPKRLVAAARASFEPFATNDTAEGRAQNNRVEIHFTSLDKTKRDTAKKSILDTK